MHEYAATDERVFALAKRFWPGPLTMVLNRIDNNPSIDLACSGLRTLTVRMPNHPIALQLIKKSGVPIVAPSANKYQSVSPTTAQHVADGLGSKVGMILDGGACAVGVESTIIDLTGKNVVLLRAGGTAKEDIEAFLGEKVLVSSGNPNMPTAPGQLLRHYAPKNCLRINIENPEPDEFYIGFGHNDGDLNLSPSADCLHICVWLMNVPNSARLPWRPFPTTVWDWRLMIALSALRTANKDDFSDGAFNNAAAEYHVILIQNHRLPRRNGFLFGIKHNLHNIVFKQVYFNCHRLLRRANFGFTF